jgi:hypothetical protein
MGEGVLASYRFFLFKPKLAVRLHGYQATITSWTFLDQEDLMNGQENFADCVVEHVPFLNRIVRGLTRSGPMSEDIVQQTVLKALVQPISFAWSRP